MVVVIAPADRSQWFESHRRTAERDWAPHRILLDFTSAAMDFSALRWVKSTTPLATESSWNGTSGHPRRAAAFGRM
jgi:hypothetical protein